MTLGHVVRRVNLQHTGPWETHAVTHGVTTVATTHVISRLFSEEVTLPLLNLNWQVAGIGGWQEVGDQV